MRLVIQGKEISVTIKSERELTTEEIVMAHQLSTGNYEALFAKEAATTEIETEKSETKKEDFQVDDQIPFVEKGTRVSVEVLCPFCGFSGKGSTYWGNSFCKCPHCSEKLYNQFATDKAGEKNSYGCHYVANSPMIFKSEKNEFEEMFKEENE